MVDQMILGPLTYSGAQLAFMSLGSRRSGLAFIAGGNRGRWRNLDYVAPPSPAEVAYLLWSAVEADEHAYPGAASKERVAMLLVAHAGDDAPVSVGWRDRS